MRVTPRSSYALDRLRETQTLPPVKVEPIDRAVRSLDLLPAINDRARKESN